MKVALLYFFSLVLLAPPSESRCFGSFSNLVSFIPAKGVEHTTGYTTLKSSLLSKKKAVKKVQVKLNKAVEGVGRPGEVVMVTQAFFLNGLKRSDSAVLVSDEEIEHDVEVNEAANEEKRSRASALKAKIDDITFSIKRKAGPDGQLFGGIGEKAIMEELRKVLGDDFLETKGVHISAILDNDSKAVEGDIKHVGDFSANINLTSGFTAKFTVKAEQE